MAQPMEVCVCGRRVRGGERREGHTHPGWNSARELGTVVYDPFRPLSQCPAPSPSRDPVVEPWRSPWLWAVEIPRRIDEEWQTEGR